MVKKYISFPYGDYEGEYLVYGKPHGKGIFKYFDGGIYKGEWKDGKYHGKGKIIFISNDVLEFGNYKNWKKSEFRKNQLKDYRKYWKEMHGYGLALKQENFHINWGDTGELRGVWKNNLIEYGVKTESDFNKYTGEFKNNIQNGKGKLIWLNRENKKFSKFPFSGYTGEFKDAKWHGKGVYLQTDHHDYYYLGEKFEKKRIKDDRIVAEWIGKWKNGYEIGEYVVNVYYFNSKQKLEFKRVIDVKFNNKGGTPKRRISYWKMRD